MDATSTATLISGYTSDLGDVLVAALPAILTIAAAVAGLFLLVRFAKRFIR